MRLPYVLGWLLHVCGGDWGIWEIFVPSPQFAMNFKPLSKKKS